MLKLHPLQMGKKARCQVEVFSNSRIICKKDCPDIKNYRRNKKTPRKKTHQGDAIFLFLESIKMSVILIFLIHSQK